MTSEIFAEHPWLWPLAWQSTLCLAAGLGGSFLLRRHAVRAHQVLLLGLVAAVLIPALSQVVKRNQWGLLVAERAVATPERRPVAAPTDFVIPDEPLAIEPTNLPRPTRVPEATPAPASTRFKWTRAVLPAWLAISSVLLLRLAIQFLLGRRLAKRSEVLDDVQFLHMIEAAKGKVGIRAEVRVRASAQTRSPVIWCWGRCPVLLVPPESRSAGGLDWPSILCHELAHAKRHDHVSGLLAELMVCALPWQPLLWWTRQRLAALSEEACDDWVIACGQRATGYARALLGLTPQIQAALLPGVVTSRRGLAGRIRRILEDGCGNPRPGLRWTLALVTLGGCLSLGLAFAQPRPATRDARAPIAEKETPLPTEITSDDPFESIIPDSMVRFWLTDPNSRPIAGAKVGGYAMVHGETSLDQPMSTPAPASDERGEVLFDIAAISRRKIFSLNDLEEIRTKNLPQGAVYVLQKERNLGAIHGLTDADAGRSFAVRLSPLCRVHGTLNSPDLPAPMTLHETYATVQWQKIRVLQQSSEERKIDLLLPPGEYTVTFDGSAYQNDPRIRISAAAEPLSLKIAPGQRDLDLGDIKLRPGKTTAVVGQQAPVSKDQILLRLVDPNGRPVAGAKVGRFVCTLTLNAINSTDWQPAPELSDENGQVILETERYLPGRAAMRGVIYILHEQRNIGAVLGILRGDSEVRLPVVLQPVCRVHGTIESAGLAALGMPLRRINVNVFHRRDHPPALLRGSNRPEHGFEFLLPPGTYELSLSGLGCQEKEKDPPFLRATTGFQRVPITVPAGRPDLDLGVTDIQPGKWATLIGQPAPELGPMREWKNGSPVTLTNLRGQVVWLRFAGRGSEAHPNLRELVGLQEACGTKGLTIILISNWGSLNEFEQRWRQAVSQQPGGLPEIPFRIAIDGDAAQDRNRPSLMRIGATFERYGVVGYPKDILIDPAGNVIGEPDVFRAKEAISQMLAAQTSLRSAVR